MGRAGGAGREAAAQEGGSFKPLLLRSYTGMFSCTSLRISHVISFKLFK